MLVVEFDFKCMMKTLTTLATMTIFPTLASPLVSFSGVWDLTTQTLVLVKDATVYVHDKALELVPEQTRNQYVEYVNLGVAELGRVQSQVQQTLQPSFDIVKEACVGFYAVVDKRVSGFVNTIVADFERRFPRESGKIGNSLLDRVVLLVYLYIILKGIQCTSRMICRYSLGWCRRHTGNSSSKAALPAEPVIKEFKPPTGRLSEVASAPPRPSFSSKPTGK